ncbi:MAG: LCP family protein [Clostridia bacterium]|nr:LCP family protein [Clostridia bacterium]
MKIRSQKGRINCFAWIMISLLLAVTLTVTVLLIARRAKEDEPSDTPAFEERGAVSQRRNFLLLGADRVSGLTDVMMIVSLDTDGERLDILQIPRDTYAEYTESGYRKINGAANILGSSQSVCDFLAESLSLDIEGYVLFDLNSFAKAVDMIGGVEVDIPFDMEYRDSSQGLHISLSAGKQTLSGKQAEQFVRYRFGYVRGDLGRIDAQKLFMSAFFNKVKEEVSGFRLMRIATSLIGEIDTNVKLSDAISLATTVLSIDAENINMLTLAGEDVRSEASGAWFFVMSEPAAREQLSRYFGADTDGRGFDSRGAFLYESSESFSRIYRSYVMYEVSNVSDISKNGIKIEKH